MRALRAARTTTELDSDGGNGRRAAYTSARPAIQAMVPESASRILDLGCAEGALGAALKARQRAVVVGIERDPAFATRARDRLDQVVQADLNECLLSDSLEEGLGRFDCIIAADVLEHLIDPWSVLSRATVLLDVDGVAIVSVPNVQNWRTLRALVVTGSWPREPSGLFDRTHLRWFTRRDAEELVKACGLTPDYLHRRWSRDDRTLKRFLDATPLRDFFAMQYLIRARKLS